VTTNLSTPRTGETGEG